MPVSQLHMVSTGAQGRNPHELPSFSYEGPDTRAHFKALTFHV